MLFQKSITFEIDIIKNRVRNLIGDANWSEEGRYKEAVLKNIVKKFIPQNLSVGTGFIIKGNEYDFRNADISNQLDIIIYDNTYPLLFSEGDFIITTASNVKAIIEVKTKITNNNGHSYSLQNIIEKFNRLSVFSRIANNNRIFKGVFSFEYDGNIDSPRVEEILRISNGLINHICLGSKIFIRYWEDNLNLNPPVNCDTPFYNIYKLDNLSFSYFISNLIHMITEHDLNERLWYSFPLSGTKEENRLKTISL